MQVTGQALALSESVAKKLHGAQVVPMAAEEEEARPLAMPVKVAKKSKTQQVQKVAAWVAWPWWE